MSEKEQEPSTNSPGPQSPVQEGTPAQSSEDVSQPPSSQPKPQAAWSYRAWEWVRSLLLNMWSTFDAWVEMKVEGIANRFSPHKKHFTEFFSPVLAGAAGYIVFELAGAFGVVTLEKKSAAEALFEDVAKSLANPYVLLALFLTSFAALIGSGLGQDIISKYVIAPFLDLTEHVMMLAFGVVVAWVFIDSLHEPKWATLAKLVWVGTFLVSFAYGCVLGKRLCRGAYAKFSAKLHRRVMVRLVGGALSIVFLYMLVHYPERLAQAQADSRQVPSAHAKGAPSALPTPQTHSQPIGSTSSSGPAIARTSSSPSQGASSSASAKE